MWQAWCGLGVPTVRSEERHEVFLGKRAQDWHRGPCVSTGASPSAGDLKELPRVPLRGEGSCGGGGAPRDSAGQNLATLGPAVCSEMPRVFVFAAGRYRAWAQSWSSAALAARSVLPSNRPATPHWDGGRPHCLIVTHSSTVNRCARPRGVPRVPATSTGSLASQRHPGWGQEDKGTTEDEMAGWCH